MSRATTSRELATHACLSMRFTFLCLSVGVLDEDASFEGSSCGRDDPSLSDSVCSSESESSDSDCTSLAAFANVPNGREDRSDKILHEAEMPS